MNDDYVHTARGVSDLKAHLVLGNKYRRKAQGNEMLTRLETILKELREKWEEK
jgi:putative transposase